MWPLLLILVVAAALLYLAYLHSKLAKEVKEVKEAAQTCMTVDDWEEEVQPQIEALQRAQTTTGRHVSMLAASVRALETTRPSAGPENEEDEDLLPDFSDDRDLDETAADAAHTEDQIQAVLSSMANMFGVPRQGNSNFQPLATGAQLFIASSKRPASQTVVEEAEDEPDQLEEIEEEDDA
jgi:hypothetical protein